MSRRNVIGLFSGLRLTAPTALLHLASKGAPQVPVVAVVTINEIEAYAQALQGIREQLPNVEVLDARDEARLRLHFGQRLGSIAIAVGSGAALSLERVAPAELALINCVVLESDIEAGGGKALRVKSAVTIDIPSEVLTLEIVRLFPGRNRMGIIRGPLQTDGYIKSFEQASKKRGLSLEVMTCGHPRELVDVFLKLRAGADLVWCPPNPQLYNSATLKPLLIASLTSRLPIIGFSQQFVQAGALFGGSADFVDVGRQTASLAIRVARNEPVPPQERARKFRFAYNQRVGRLLGVKAVIPDKADEDLEIIR